MAIKDLVVRMRAEGAQQMRSSFRNAEAGMISMSARAVAVGQIMAAAFFGVVRSVRRAFGSMWSAYKEQEKADNVLIASMNAAGQNVQELLPKYRQLAAEIQNVTSVGDEQTQMMIATATNMGVASDKMDETIKGAIGLSAALRDANGNAMDYASAVKYLILAQNGEFTMLQRYMPQLRALATAEEKQIALSEAMNRGWKQKQDETGQLSVKLQQLRNAFWDLIQDFVAGAVDSSDFSSALDKIRQGIKDIDAKALGEEFAVLLRQASQFIENIDFKDLAGDISGMADDIGRVVEGLGMISGRIGTTYRVLGQAARAVMPEDPADARAKIAKYASAGPLMPVSAGIDQIRAIFTAIDSEAIRGATRSAEKNRPQEVIIVEGGPGAT